MSRRILLTVSLLPFLTAGCLLPEGRNLDDPLAGDWQCDVAIEPSAEIRQSFTDYYDSFEPFQECNAPFIDQWFNQFPDVIATYDAAYAQLQAAEARDLRGLPAAAEVVQIHPFQPEASEVFLTAAEIADLEPSFGNTALDFPGAYQKFFVDSAADILYLTSSDAGLGAIDISTRYDFKEVGRGLEANADDLYIVNSAIGYVEEKNTAGFADLVVYDVSDPANPTQIVRVANAIVSPALEGEVYTSWSYWQGGVPNLPPSFDVYMIAREGQFTFSQCNELSPIYPWNDEQVHCEADGQCTSPRRFNQAIPGNSTCAERPLEEDPAFGGWFGFNSALDAESAAPASATERGGQGGAGSLTQMMAIGNTLYVLGAGGWSQNGFLNTFDISNPSAPVLVDVMALDNMPEALTKHDNLLLVAGLNGMAVVSIGEAQNPSLLSEFIPDCPQPAFGDPIVVKEDVVLRTVLGDNCWWLGPRMEVIDLEDPANPTLIQNISLSSPMGVALLGDVLYIADIWEGVLVYDVRDPRAPRRLGVMESEQPKDLIIDGFDLYTLSETQIGVHYIAPLYEAQVASEALQLRVDDLVGYTPVRVN